MKPSKWSASPMGHGLRREDLSEDDHPTLTTLELCSTLSTKLDLIKSSNVNLPAVRTVI